MSIYPHQTPLQGSGQGHEYLLQALRQGGLGGAPLILSPRLQGLQVHTYLNSLETEKVRNLCGFTYDPQVPTTLSNGLLNGGPPPLINPADTQGLL